MCVEERFGYYMDRRKMGQLRARERGEREKEGERGRVTDAGV